MGHILNWSIRLTMQGSIISSTQSTPSEPRTLFYPVISGSEAGGCIPKGSWRSIQTLAKRGIPVGDIDQMDNVNPAKRCASNYEFTVMNFQEKTCENFL